MSRNILYVVLALILAAELQLTSCQEGVTSQHDNSSLPVSYSATVLEGGGQVCPPEEQLEMARAEIAEDILNNDIFDVHCPGQIQENPALSCLAVSQCDPQLPIYPMLKLLSHLIAQCHSLQTLLVHWHVCRRLGP